MAVICKLFFSFYISEIPENSGKLSPPTCSRNAVTSRTTSCSTSVFASVFASSSAASTSQSSSASSFSSLMSSLARSDCPTTFSTISAIEPTSLSLSTSLYLSTNDSSLLADQQGPRQYSASPQPALSATALLQKAAQMGATTSNASFLRGLGLATASFSGQDDSAAKNWNSHVKVENNSLGLGLGSSGDAGFADMSFASQPMTRDLLGLSIGGAAGGATRGGHISALLTSLGGAFDVAEGERSSPAQTWEDAQQREATNQPCSRV
ncbi:hypothetical protein L6164_015371 [Bauhinia variegata]|uniref:Uncharacterized protein n=1 Tax=Bauhinia variegata TaxID=167791 RepID=A0ACB9NM41_BAUVA|nr:hypothetical protein L6164_015371 [Bauhinia variegata]